ncbi:MAG: hypothetical protein QOG53_1568 [Frankiales bacterium]|jgi:hypothetical protein|nr:hypothetical protein [Frankiales bacterium]
MALRDKLAARVQPFLKPEERVVNVFLTQQGLSPYLMFLSTVFIFWFKFRIVAVTHSRIVVFTASAWRPAKPRAVFGTLPRETRFGLTSGGLWAKIDLEGQKFYVHKRFQKDVRAADAAIGAS